MRFFIVCLFAGVLIAQSSTITPVSTKLTPAQQVQKSSADVARLTTLQARLTQMLDPTELQAEVQRMIAARTLALQTQLAQTTLQLSSAQAALTAAKLAVTKEQK